MSFLLLIFLATVGLNCRVCCVVLLEGPSAITAKAGNDVLLRCLFDTDATNYCNWLHNATSVVINAGRYILNGNQSIGDCSLTISQVNQMDAGYWNCEYKASSSSTNPVTSSQVLLTVKDGLSGGAIAGIVIGCLVLVALIATGVYFLMKKLKKDKRHSGKSSYTKGEERPTAKPRPSIEVRVEGGH